jgi:hypothetical protein
MFSEENQFLLLLNSSKETRSKILAEHKELEDVINVINENEAVLRKLSDGTTKPRNRLLFYQKIIHLFILIITSQVNLLMTRMN